MTVDHHRPGPIGPGYPVGMTDPTVDRIPRLLVLADRAGADDAAETVAARLPGLVEPPHVVRDALAGEDDAEDAQWLVVCEPPTAGWTVPELEVLEGVAADADGWVEAAED